MYSDINAYFIKGGFCMWPLLICSITALAIFIYKIIFFYYSFSNKHTVDSIHKLLIASHIDEAKEILKHDNSDIAQLVYNIISDNVSLSRWNYEYIIKDKVNKYIAIWESKMQYLDIIVSIAPSIGLLGTITGIMQSFGALNNRFSDLYLITAGIDEALITTVYGLSIAIVGNFMIVYLKNRINQAKADIESISGLLIKYCSISI